MLKKKIFRDKSADIKESEKKLQKYKIGTFEEEEYIKYFRKKRANNKNKRRYVNNRLET
jgi:hypothetical protein